MSDAAAATRTRISTWPEPSELAARAPEFSGLEFTSRIARGELPQPAIGPLLDMWLTDATDGAAEYQVRPQEFHYNPMGTVHGGLAAAMIDSGTGIACQTTVPRGVGFTTMSLQVDYLKGITVDSGLLSARGKVVKRGRQTIIADADLTGPDGTVYARGSTTCIVLPKMASAPPAAPGAGLREYRCSWDDPLAMAKARRSMTGLEFFTRMAKGELPPAPMYQACDIEIVALGDGWSEFACTPGPHQYNPLGSLHGGIAATLIDSACGVSLQSTLAPSFIPATMRLSIDYLRGIWASTGPLTCRGRLSHRTETVAFADSEIVDAKGNLLVRGSGRFMISKVAKP
ncbi:MAG: PaaI family thioesterase [Alphaproteobacteria bacterium]